MSSVHIQGQNRLTAQRFHQHFLLLVNMNRDKSAAGGEVYSSGLQFKGLFARLTATVHFAYLLQRGLFPLGAKHRTETSLVVCLFFVNSILPQQQTNRLSICASAALFTLLQTHRGNATSNCTGWFLVIAGKKVIHTDIAGRKASVQQFKLQNIREVFGNWTTLTMAGGKVHIIFTIRRQAGYIQPRPDRKRQKKTHDGLLKKLMVVVPPVNIAHICHSTGLLGCTHIAQTLYPSCSIVRFLPVTRVTLSLGSFLCVLNSTTPIHPPPKVPPSLLGPVKEKHRLQQNGTISREEFCGFEQITSEADS